MGGLAASLTTRIVESLYDEVASEYDQRWSRNIDLAEDEVLYGDLTELAHGASVLDIGCGTGRLLDFINPRNYVGIDPSEGMLREARRKHDRQVGPTIRCYNENAAIEPAKPEQRRSFIHARAEETLNGVMAVPTDARLWFYDVVVALWSFSYLDRPRAILELARKLTAPGGVCVVHAYSHRYAQRGSYVFNGRPTPPHRPSDPAELALMMTLAGFKDVRIRPFRVVPDNPVFDRLPVGVLARYLRWERDNLPCAWGLTYVASGRA